MIARSRTDADDNAGGRVAFERARELVVALTHALPAERVPLAAARERIAAAALLAGDDLVPYARSAMDGYALRAADTVAAPGAQVHLPVTGAVYAGDAPLALTPGHAAAIATGAPLPPGADAVVPHEDILRSGSAIVLHAPLVPGQHVFPGGDDACRGDVLVARGELLGAGRIGLLAAAGYAAVRVHRRPRIALVCTGDELVAVGATPGFGQVRNSNATMLAAQLERDGADVVSCAHVPDAVRPLTAALAAALAASDLVITTGGASVGERDLVKGTFTALGARFAFTSVALRPAKPSAFGRCGTALVAVLPGNPAAAFAGYALLVRGVVRRLAGVRDAFPAAVDARLDGEIRSKPERHYAAFARLEWSRGAFAVVPLGNQCSSLVRTSAEANAFIIAPPGECTYRAGETVRVEVPDWNAVPFIP